MLADDIGIIDHGALLEEESLAELEQKSSKHIRFTLSDTAQAARILERNFHENHFSIQDDHNLRLHNLDLPVGKIVTAFVENGLEVSEAHTCEESLEDYFKDVYKRQVCGRAVAPDGRQTYCSAACAKAAHRRQQREYMRKKRG